MSYEDLKTLEELRRNGSISEEEYQREKQKVFDRTNGNPAYKKEFLGMKENSYIALMHVSQLAGYILPFFGFITPVILWLMNKDNSAKVDATGKDIINFILTWLIYSVGAGILCLVLIGIPVLIALGVMQFIFVIIAAIKTNNGESWKYPLTITLLR
jgi:uncharacterized Tic20 family protein